MVACCEGKEKRRRFILSSKQPPQTEKRKKTRVKSIQAADLLVWLLSQLEQIPIYPNAHKFKVIKKKRCDFLHCPLFRETDSVLFRKVSLGNFPGFLTPLSYFLERPTQKYFRPLKVKPNSDLLRLGIRADSKEAERERRKTPDSICLSCTPPVCLLPGTVLLVCRNDSGGFCFLSIRYYQSTLCMPSCHRRPLTLDYLVLKLRHNGISEPVSQPLRV